MRILLVESDEAIIQVLRKNLENQHYVVDVVKTGEAGWRYGSAFDYGLIMLATALPEINGICLCQRLRAEGCTTPILLLTADTTSALRIQGLDAGADDCVAKPFDIAELSARIRALLRRGKTNASPILTWENLLLNPSTCEVQYHGQPLTLTAKEYELLELLLRDSQHVFSIDEILDSLWSSEEFPAEATVRSHIRHLRHKLNAAGAPDLIATVHGRGYYLRSPASTVETAETAETAETPARTADHRLRPSILLLIVDGDPAFTQPLIEQAAKREIRTAIAPTAAAAWAWLLPTASSTVDLVLVRLATSDAFNSGERLGERSGELSERQSLLQMLIQHSIPNLTVGSHWADSLHGAPVQQRLEPSASTEQLFTAIEELLKQQNNCNMPRLDYRMQQNNKLSNINKQIEK